MLLLPTQWYIPASDRRADTIMRVPLSRSIALSSSTTAPLWYQVMAGGGWPVITHCSMTVEPFMTASSEMEICTNSGPSSHEEEEEEEVKNTVEHMVVAMVARYLLKLHNNTMNR